MAAAEQQTGTHEDAKRRGDIRDRQSAIVNRLQLEADRRVSAKNLVEKRWIDNIQQYHGRYDSKTEKRLIDAGKSTVFITETRAKTNAMEARLSDMLFPTDDKNWGIKPTPVPELTEQADAAMRQAMEAKAKAAEAPEGPEGQPARQEAATKQTAADELRAKLDEAAKRCKAMEAEIEDQHRECNYQIEMREVIRDACRLGAGIAKGPVVAARARSSWKAEQVSDDNGRTFTVYNMEQESDKKVAFYRVDPWSYFPDMDATSPEDSESDFERHLWNAKQIRKLAKNPSFDKDAIRRVLKDEPRTSAPQYISDLRSLTGAFHDTGINRYHVWEYHGPLTAEEMRDIAEAMGDEDKVADIPEDIDPLEEVIATVWFCQGEVLKFGIHPLDSGDSLYSVFCLEKDEASIFGFGVPHLVHDSQSALNGAWRMMLDNAELSTSPQIVVNEEVVEPVNRRWGLKGGKVWKRKTGAPQQAAAFESYDIPSNQPQLAAIVEMAKGHMDEESMVPVIAQGEQGTHTTQTLGGMSILMNASNVVFRRVVKNYDDDMTTPNIRRNYDWNMQFSDKEEIKGDFDVDARGTSVLLVRELQAQNIMAFLMNFGTNPAFSGFLRDGGLPALRLLVQTMMLPSDEVLLTLDEYTQEQANSTPPPDYEMLKLTNARDVATENNKAKMEALQFERDTAMMVEAARQNMTIEDLRARVQMKREEIAGKERGMAAELAYTERQREQNPEATTGGGYV